MTPTPAALPAKFRRTSPRTDAARVAAILFCISACGCVLQEDRLLDPKYSGETYKAELRFRFEWGASPKELLRQIRPGDIIALSDDEPGSQSSNLIAAAFSTIGHVGVVCLLSPTQLRVFSSSSDLGTHLATLESCLGRRDFFVYSFGEGLLDQTRLAECAVHAAALGVLDYDWSAVLGLNSNLTPNNLLDISDEYTCATAVAAALHYAGLSLDSALGGLVTPYDIISSVARRNLNGPGASRNPTAAEDEEPRRAGRAGRP